MCRQNQLWGCVLMAFGLGILIGTWISGGFFSFCFGLGLIILGVCLSKKH